jgi:hypothetical protein
MSRCEGYYRLENRRCDRDANGRAAADDGETYAVCAYHGRDAWRTQVARWDGESGVRRSRPTHLAAERVATATAA